MNVGCMPSVCPNYAGPQHGIEPWKAFLQKCVALSRDFALELRDGLSVAAVQLLHDGHPARDLPERREALRDLRVLL